MVLLLLLLFMEREHPLLSLFFFSLVDQNCRGASLPKLLLQSNPNSSFTTQDYEEEEEEYEKAGKAAMKMNSK